MNCTLGLKSTIYYGFAKQIHICSCMLCEQLKWEFSTVRHPVTSSFAYCKEKENVYIV